MYYFNAVARSTVFPFLHAKFKKHRSFFIAPNFLTLSKQDRK